MVWQQANEYFYIRISGWYTFTSGQGDEFQFEHTGTEGCHELKDCLHALFIDSG